MASKRGKPRIANAEPAGLWHQPALMHLIADVLFALGIVGLGWAALVSLQRLPLFPLREVVLTAAPQHVGVAQLAHAARTSASGNFFTVDLAAVQAGIEALPWVRRAAVRRHWPDGLMVTLEEHEAVAQWRHLNGEKGLINTFGEVFDAEPPEDAPFLPLLSGPPKTAAEILRRLAIFDGQLAPLGRHVTALTLSPRRAWHLELDDGVTIELGRDEERQPLNARLTRFVAHYPDIKAHFGSIRGADMRYPNGFALIGAGRPVEPLPPVKAGKQS
ncbi:cell division protein FtsQ/DivIB [Sulfuricystis multivorans]|uniref:cell division protein FtsQ/DivIB n=1 Tax=Sulfuricystis multivorans TaxID=2211108 RepID=UPI0024DF54DF|nr:cell division protein FtsQ/DivIB [Sulfuricystis multivorans]